VLKDSPVFDAIRSAWEGGAVVAASSAGAMAVCDPMIDPRGGAFTVGLGLVVGVAVLPHASGQVAEEHKRTLELADPTTCVVAVPERTAVIRSADGTWRATGAAADRVEVHRGDQPAQLSDLP
jgi:cyanophycinase